MCQIDFKYKLKFNANLCAFKDQESMVNDWSRLGWGSTGSSGVCCELQLACPKGDSQHSASAGYCRLEMWESWCQFFWPFRRNQKYGFSCEIPRFFHYCVCQQSVCCPLIIPQPQAFSIWSFWKQGLCRLSWLLHGRREGKTALS